MKRLASILCLALSLTLTSCGLLYEGLERQYEHMGRDPKPARHKTVSNAKHDDNLRWMHEHYSDAKLTRQLNAR